MNRRFFCALVLAALLLCANAYAEFMPELVRLQVIAEDDCPEAQRLKLELRDTCLRCAAICLGDAADVDGAFARLNHHLSDFTRACRARAAELGYDGEICVETGVFAFPNRVYGNVLVPKGDYRALRVTVGKGEGHNWWCVLYPSLCRLDEANAAATDAQSVLTWLDRWLKWTA